MVSASQLFEKSSDPCMDRAAMAVTHEGLVINSDIIGYMGLLNQSELEHA
jgi:hypothetical protein